MHIWYITVELGLSTLQFIISLKVDGGKVDVSDDFYNIYFPNLVESSKQIFRRGVEEGIKKQKVETLWILHKYGIEKEIDKMLVI